MFGTQVNLKFREKYRNRKKLVMPSIATQTCSISPREIKASGGVMTPPDSSSGSHSMRSSPTSSVESLHGPRTPYDHLRDAFEDVPKARKPRLRVRGMSGKARPSIHIHLDNVHVTPLRSPVSAKPQMVDAGIQAGEPQVPLAKASQTGLIAGLKRCFAPLRPYWNVVWTVALFFLDRVGFGVRLN